MVLCQVEAWEVGTRAPAAQAIQRTDLVVKGLAEGLALHRRWEVLVVRQSDEALRLGIFLVQRGGGPPTTRM